MTVEASYQEYRPTLTERFWRMIGFRHAYVHRFNDDEFPELASSWMITDNKIAFSWADRFRVLLSGKVHLQICQKTNVAVDTCISRSAVGVLPPWERK